MFRMKFFKKPKETKLFPVSEYTPHQDQLKLAHQIAEIYSEFISSRDIEHKVGDGLLKLFDNNFRAVIKKMAYTVILSGKSHFYIVVPYSNDPHKPTKKGFSCLCYNFGEVLDESSYFLNNIHKSRIISMKSSFLNFESLKKQQYYEHAA
ncbi:hypothetical protein [Borreliella valaisiana]|uniref:hypothetical protein n=1 Tax=Borreliella valaisiana TaxID=62088 RepID=UPI001F2CDD68|nr:hypothetical protein [Borreliella valaisiana]